jgi:hypothetical protein
MANNQGGGSTITKRILDDTIAGDNGLWHQKPPEEAGPSMVRLAEKYEKGTWDRRDSNRRYVQLHKGKLIGGSIADSGRAPTPSEDLHPAWNIVQAAINTASSVVTRNKVRVAVITDEGDWELQDAAKQAELFVAGVFRGNKLYEELDQRFFLYGAAAGLGIALVEPCSKTGEVRIKCMNPDELVYSEVEAKDGTPRQLFRVEWMSKWDAILKYGDTDEKRRAIESCNTTYSIPLIGSPDYHMPLIPIWTGWYLPSGQDAGDGVKCVAIPNYTLDHKEWKWSRFPLSFFRVEIPTAGIWGIGIAERLAGFQYRLIEINADIDEARRMGSLGKWLVDVGSNINDDEFTDEQGGIIHYARTPPQWVTNDGIPESLLRERTETYNQGLREIGLSEWSVGGVQPDNIKSGEGLRVLEQKEEGRAIPCGQNWESFHVDIAENVIMAAIDGHEINPKLSVMAQAEGGDGMARIEFSKVAKLLNSVNSHYVQAYPTAILPSSPQGKFETVKEWQDKGWIDSATAAALSDQPDIDQESSLQLSGIKAVRHSITEILRKGQKGYEPPDPAMPLELGARIAQSTYLKGLRTGIPEDRLNLLMEWHRAVQDLLTGKPPTPLASTPGVAAPSAPVAPQNAPPPLAPVSTPSPGAVPPAPEAAPSLAPLPGGEVGPV